MKYHEKNGLIFQVKSNYHSDHLTIILEDGLIKVICNDFDGNYAVKQSSKSLKGRTQLFDTVVVKKDQNTITLIINGKSTNVNSNFPSTSADTNQPIYFGGLPGIETNYVIVYKNSFKMFLNQ